MRVSIIGFGEVGALLAQELRTRATLCAWDVLFADPASAPSIAARTLAVRAGVSAADAVDGADVVISAVTAAQTCAAVTAAAPGLKPSAFYFDLNSASPRAKIDAAQTAHSAGARYVEAAVMAPIAPKGAATAILLGGPHAEAFAPTALALGFTGARYYDVIPGRAAAAKLCRSVVIKGMEALLTESLLAAHHYGVTDDVVDSLSNLLPGVDWRTHAPYMISRAIEHGARRAEEMHEAARTVAEAGVTPLMSEACATRQAWAAATFSSVEARTLAPMLDAMREKL